jgi:hypothetical protein
MATRTWPRAPGHAHLATRTNAGSSSAPARQAWINDDPNPPEQIIAYASGSVAGGKPLAVVRKPDQLSNVNSTSANAKP